MYVFALLKRLVFPPHTDKKILKYKRLEFTHHEENLMVEGPPAAGVGRYPISIMTKITAMHASKWRVSCIRCVCNFCHRRIDNVGCIDYGCGVEVLL